MTKLCKYLCLVNLLMLTQAIHAETINCTAITTLPFEVTKAGVYCLTGNLSSNRAGGSAIKIKASDVTIDLNGWLLNGLGAGSATKAVGIYAFKRSNITIKNGTIRGFYHGIMLFDPNPYATARGHLVENIQAQRNTFTGIQVNGSFNIVRHNQVTDTGNSTFLPGQRAFGIQFYGSSGRLIDNDISRTKADSRADGYGVVLGSAHSSVVKGNRINDVRSDTGKTYGLYISSSDEVLVRGNYFINMANGVFYTSSNGKNMDNLNTNVTTPYTGGILTGIND